MIFESVNYSFLLQDFLFSMGAGFVVGVINQLLSVVLYRGKVRLFIKDMLVCFVFAVVVFSYVVSFANYQIVRIYHILGAFVGFLAFNINFSAIFHKFFEKIFLFLKNKILCHGKKVFTTVCDLRAKCTIKRQKEQNVTEAAPLKSEEVIVYNL